MKLSILRKVPMKFEEYYNRKQFVIVSGLHGDEPAGNSVAEKFKNESDVLILSNLNPTNKRRIDNKDPNRQFDKDGEFQNNILNTIEETNPILVISLHEDDEVDGVYVYCSPYIKEQVKASLKDIDLPLASKAHTDETDEGVITKGKQPYEGTLERALEKRNIFYCTIETPSKENFEKRVDSMTKIVHNLLNIFRR